LNQVTDTQNTTFDNLGLAEPIRRAVAAEGYTTPTPIQARAIPHLLTGRDLLGVAQTGTGKTAAFALPMLQRLSQDRRPPVPKCPRALVLTPTRELAIQIDESFKTYGRHLGLRHAVVFGGVGQHPQAKALAKGLDILVATPGRLLDLMGQNLARLDRLEIFVLDEADRMLDMGFIHDVRRIIATLPAQRQTLLFSATMPADIANLAGSILRDPAKVEVTPVASTAERIDQWVLFVEKADKRALLGEVLKDGKINRALVFTRTKHGANRLAEQLEKMGISADAIHGNKSQSARQRALADFTAGKLRILVATDIAARGIDIDGITHVINYELPNVPESYVHRIGRTARAGAEGVALSFCDHEERAYLRDIERLIRRSIPVVPDHPFKSTVTELRQPKPPQQQRQQNRGPRRHRGGGRQRRFG
jgi:ATP-dependent RNA helicase RhlE